NWRIARRCLEGTFFQSILRILRLKQLKSLSRLRRREIDRLDLAPVPIRAIVSENQGSIALDSLQELGRLFNS
ncbi:MAG TPA: hypothetical protein VJW76_03260, partial [Verrucomicrobiae bacterium]|nr:hypothetical protein [Verrucomicrobiae bacterium]